MLRKINFSALKSSVAVSSLLIEIVVLKNLIQLESLETSGKVNYGF